MAAGLFSHVTLPSSGSSAALQLVPGCFTSKHTERGSVFSHVGHRLANRGLQVTVCKDVDVLDKKMPKMKVKKELKKEEPP